MLVQMNSLIKYLDRFMLSIMDAMPSIIGAFTLLILGWLLARLLSFIVSKVLKKAKIDTLAEKPPFSEYLQQGGVKTKPSDIAKRLVFWVIYLIFIVSAIDTLGLDMVTAEMSRLIGYLPRLFSALIIFLIGIYFISFVRDFIRTTTGSLGMSAGKFISSITFYLLITVLTLTTLKQAGIDTHIITDNLSIIIGGIILAFAISYGFASRDILQNILASFFSQRLFKEGQTIEFGDLKGEIIEIQSVTVRLKTDDGEVLVPTHQLLNNQVKIIDPGANLKTKPSDQD